MPSYTALSVSRPILSFSTHLLWFALTIIITSNTMLHADEYTTKHPFSDSENALPLGVTPEEIADITNRCYERYAPSGYNPDDGNLFDTLQRIGNLPQIDALNPSTGPNPLTLSENDARKLLEELHRASYPIARDKNTFESLISRLSVFYPLDDPKKPSVGIRIDSWNWIWNEDGSFGSEASCLWVANPYGASITGDLKITGPVDYMDFSVRSSAAINQSGGSLDVESGTNFHLGELFVDLWTMAGN